MNADELSRRSPSRSRTIPRSGRSPGTFAEGRSPTPWTAGLVRIVAESGAVDLEFVYGDADEWDVTP